MANAFIFEHILSTSSMRKCMAISLENLYVIIGLKVYVCPNVDVFNYISVQGKGQSARSYLPSTDSVVSRSLKSFFFHSFLTVIHFHASWAAQCTQMNDVMTELAKDNTHVKFYKVNVTLIIYNPLTLRTSYGKIICLANFLICEWNPVLIIIQNVKRLW